jgi:hypothetical protein
LKTTVYAILGLAVAMWLPTFALASDLAGFWQPDEKPVWVEIAFVDGVGTGTVRRHDGNPDAVGFALIRELRPAQEAGSWQGEIWAEQFKEYKQATFTSPSKDDMTVKVKVGFLSRTVQWMRAEAPL